MSDASPATSPTPAALPAYSPGGWRDLIRKEDWLSVWLGLGIVLTGYALFANQFNFGWIAVAPSKWSTWVELNAQLSANAARYAAQFVAFVAVLTAVTALLGFRPREFIPSFVLVYLLSFAVFVAGSWSQSQRYNLEPPLLALLIGLVLSNVFRLPRSLNAGFRVEFFVKLGIVLLGATLPFTLILWAGPVAVLQAGIVSLLTFGVIFYTARRLGLEPSFAATLGAGGAVCGVSAAIAVAGAVRAKKEYPPVAITLVVFWAIVFVFALPLVSRQLHLPAGVGGAWIGTSEFADAAGLAAAQSYGGSAGPTTGISGTAAQALTSYTLIKVIGRDVWIGIWAFVLALISVTRWERDESGRRPDTKQIWWRFPKFVIGFILASLLVTVVVRHFSLADYNRLVKPGFVLPITALRTWAFTFSFLSIGLSTRLSDFASARGRPFWAFTAGVVVNVVGYILSVWVFGHYWANLAP